MKKKILFVAHSGTLAGGGERSLLDMVLHTAKNTSKKVTVAIPFEGDFSKKLKGAGIPWVIVPAPFCIHPTPGEENGLLWKSVAFSDAMSEGLHALLNIKPDLVIANTIVNPWILEVAKLFNTPTALCVREIHDSRNGLDLAPSSEIYITRLASLVDTFIFNSQFSKSTYEDLIPTRHPSLITYPSVKIPEASLSRASRDIILSSEAAKILFIGNIAEHKRPFDIVKAVSKILEIDSVPKVHLTIKGGANSEKNKQYLADIEEYIDAKNLGDYISFEPFSNDPYSSYLEHDIVVMASTDEAFGRVTLEGQRLGRLVIGADAGGTREIIEDNKTGILYTPGDVDNLADKILYALKNRDDMRKIAKNGYKESAKKYSTNAVYNDFDTLVNDSDTYKDAPVYDESRLLGDPIYSLIIRNRYMNDKLSEYATSLQVCSADLESYRKNSIPLKTRRFASKIKRKLKSIASRT